MSTPSQSQTRRSWRTAVQVIVGLAAAAPILLPTLGVPETAAGYGVALAVAAGITRIMNAPRLQPVLRRLGLDVREGARE